MVIKSPGDYWIEVVTLGGGAIIFPVIMAGAGAGPQWWLWYVIVTIGYLILYIIFLGRTFILDEEGCTVCFFRYRKKYRWDELEVKRIQNYLYSFGQLAPHTGCVVLSPLSSCRSVKTDPMNYGLRHPLTFIFLQFRKEVTLKEKIDYYPGARVYPVDEAEFREKMKLWNVELEEFFKDRWGKIYQKK